MKGVIQIDVLFALFCIMFFVYQHGIYANDDLGKENKHEGDYIIISKAEFKQSNEHSFGFDDYTEWNNKTFYYARDKRGQCKCPYLSLETSNSGYINLTVNCTKNIQQSSANIIQQSIDLEVDKKIISISPNKVNIDSNQASNNPISMALGSIDNTEIVKLNATYNENKVEAHIYCYPKKYLSVRIVKVNGNSNDNISTPDFSCFTKQAMIYISIETDIYNIDSILINGRRHTIGENTIWSRKMLEQLSNDYKNLHSQTIQEDCIMYLVKGTIMNGRICGLTDDGPNPVCWVLSNKSHTKTAPHELGHYLGLKDKNGDNDALMGQTDSSTNNQSVLLRKDEWQKTRINAKNEKSNF